MYAKMKPDGSPVKSDGRCVRSDRMITVNATPAKMRELGFKPYFEDEPPEGLSISDPVFVGYVESEDEIRLVYKTEAK